jgi:hypothetical protein
MPKNKGKGGKNRRRGKNENEETKRQLEFKEPGQEYSQVVRCVEINQCVGCPILFSAMTRPSWLGRAARNRHRHAIEQASRRWRGGRRGDSARTRRKILISTQVVRMLGNGRCECYCFDGVTRLGHIRGKMRTAPRGDRSGGLGPFFSRRRRGG